MKKLAVALAFLAAAGVLLLALFGGELGLTVRARGSAGTLSAGTGDATAEAGHEAPGTGAPAPGETAAGPGGAAGGGPTPDALQPAWVPAEAIANGRGAIVAEVVLRPGVPAAGAVADLAGPSVRQAFTDDGGRLLFGALAPGSRYRVQVSALGYERLARTEIAVRAGKVTDLGLLDLSGGSGRGPVNAVSVLVTRKDDKKPVAGAKVALTNVRPYGTYLAFGTKGKPGAFAIERPTNEEGRAEFAGLRVGIYDMLVSAEGLALGVRENIPVRRDSSDRVEIALSPGLALAGRVVDGKGNPVPGAGVVGLNVAMGFKTYPPVASDEKGAFRLTGLDNGNYWVMAFAEGYAQGQVTNVRPGKEDVEVVLKPAGGVEGVVVSTATGAPLASFSIRAYPAGPFEYVYSESKPFADPEGKFRLSLTPGNYTLDVSAEGHSLQEVTGVKVPAEAPLRIELEGAGVVSGIVRQRGTSLPIPGAEIFVKKGGFPPYPSKDLFVVSGPDGGFRMAGLPLRSVNLHVTHPEYSSSQIQGAMPSLEGGEPVLVELGTGGAVEGTVTGEDGLPQASVRVNLFQGADFLVGARNVTTGADGRFRFEPVTPGKYSLATGEMDPSSAGEMLTVEVKDGQTTTVQVGVRKSHGVDLTGTLTRGGAVVPDTTVSLLPQAAGGGESPTVQGVKTGADGRFLFKQVPPGRYSVSAQLGDAQTAVEVEVPATGTPPDVQLRFEDAAIRGTVRAPDGSPVSGAWVTLEKVVATAAQGLAGAVLTWRGQAMTSTDGTFAMKGLEDGEYRLRTYEQRYGTEILEGLRVAGGVGTDSVVVTLTHGRQVSGTISAPGGGPIEGANVTARDSAGREVALFGFATSGSDGRYTYSGLRAESYRLEAQAPGYAPAAASVDLSNAVSLTADFTLHPGGTLRIEAKDASDAPVAGATVALLTPTGEPVTTGVSILNFLEGAPTGTDSQGIFRWKDLAAGDYRVRVTKAGFPMVEASATAVAGSEVAVSVKLGP